jgi:hypothetical protein
MILIVNLALITNIKHNIMAFEITEIKKYAYDVL